MNLNKQCLSCQTPVISKMFNIWQAKAWVKRWRRVPAAIYNPPISHVLFLMQGSREAQRRQGRDTVAEAEHQQPPWKHFNDQWHSRSHAPAAHGICFFTRILRDKKRPMVIKSL